MKTIEAKYWNVNEFRKVDKRWGNFRRIIGELPIGSTDGIIYLMEENDDHRKSIAVHDKRNGNMIVKLGFYWVDSVESQQKALNTIFDTLMMG